jgi:hypothetical protein
MARYWIVETRNVVNERGFGWLTGFVLGLFAVIVVLAAWGCEAPADLGPVREQAAETQSRLDGLEEKQREALDAAKASGDAEGAAKAEKALATIAEAKKATATAEGILTQATNPDGTLNPEGAATAAGAAVMAINPVAGVAITVIGGALGALWRQRQTSRARDEAEANLRAASEIVRSIEAAKRADAGFAEAFKRNAPTIAGVQGEQAKDLVDKVQGFKTA